MFRPFPSYEATGRQGKDEEAGGDEFHGSSLWRKDMAISSPCSRERLDIHPMGMLIRATVACAFLLPLGAVEGASSYATH